MFVYTARCQTDGCCQLSTIEAAACRLSVDCWLWWFAPANTHTHTHNAIQLNSTQRVDQHSSVSVAAGNQACNFESISENHQSFVGKYIIKCQSHKRTLIARGHACAIFITPPTHAPPRSSHLGIDIDCTLRSYIDLFTISVYKAPRCFNSLWIHFLFLLFFMILTLTGSMCH